jgi:proline iminopeptidase
MISVYSFASDSTFYFKTSDNVKLYVRVAGKGKPCVFVHGGPGSTSYYYESMMGAPLIEQKIKMVYFDQRGCGRSDSALNGDYSLSRMEKDLEELRTALGFHKWAVMGHSFGGILITNYAYHYPKSVSALLLIHCTLNMQASMSSHLEFGLKELDIKDQAAFRDSTKPLQERVWKVHEKLTEKNLWYKLMYRNAYEKSFNDSITFSIGKFNREYANKVWNVSDYWKDFTPLTSSIKCPVLVMTGDADYAIGPNHYKSFHFPHQTFIHYIGGHAPFQEEPQWYAEKIIDFTNKLQ